MELGFKFIIASVKRYGFIIVYGASKVNEFPNTAKMPRWQHFFTRILLISRYGFGKIAKIEGNEPYQSLKCIKER